MPRLTEPWIIGEKKQNSGRQLPRVGFDYAHCWVALGKLLTLSDLTSSFYFVHGTTICLLLSSSIKWKFHILFLSALVAIIHLKENLMGSQCKYLTINQTYIKMHNKNVFHPISPDTLSPETTTVQGVLPSWSIDKYHPSWPIKVKSKMRSHCSPFSLLLFSLCHYNLEIITRSWHIQI